MAVNPRVALAAIHRHTALYVVKVGSSSLRHERVFDELAEIHRRGVRVLLIAGGARDIADHYATIGRPVRTLPMRDDGEVRYCPPEEMEHVVAGYEQLTLPRVRQRLADRGLSGYAVTAHTGGLVTGTPNRPVRVVEDGRTRVVRDHRAGTVRAVDADRVRTLLDAFDVVCLSAPVAADDGGAPLNVDADVLAAELANALDADHLRLVTGTAGLLARPSDPRSTLADLRAGQGMSYAGGRMRQKVRAAEIALAGTADVAITGPHTVRVGSGTRFWRAPAPRPDLDLLARMVEISSVSGDERELGEFLVDWCGQQDVPAHLDAVGNLVASRGTGPRRLLLLGHLDTVPFRWCTGWAGDTLTGRGCVDAKAALAVFLETLAGLAVGPDTTVTVVGTVEEERTADGAFHVRDHYPSDAVVVGEPSGTDALTIGYHGVCKAKLSVRQEMAHTAGRGARSAGVLILDAVGAVREAVSRLHDDVLFSVLSLHTGSTGDTRSGEAVVDIRVPPAVDVFDLVRVVERSATEPVRVQVLLGTPGVLTPRGDPLVRAFSRSVRAILDRPVRLLAKKGSSDMNTLATAWRGVPMVAYGPGDAALDHTPHERIDAADYRLARTVLDRAVRGWLATTAGRPGPVEAAR